MAGEHPRPSSADRRARKAEVDDPAVVLDAAARYLETTPRSIAEVRRHLGRAGYRPQLVEAAIARLTELGMLDDAAFAAQWVESRDRAHPRGEMALMLELRRKGIEASVVAAVLQARRAQAVRWDAGDADGGDPDAAPRDASADEIAAERLLRARERTLGRVADPRLRRQRAYALLARNGFAPDVCAEVSRRVVSGSAADDAPD